MIQFSRLLIVLLSGLSGTLVLGQGATDLYRFELKNLPDGSLTLGQAQWLSGCNPGGYMSQPWYTPDGQLLVSVRMAGDTQNDIWSLAPDRGTYWKVTETRDSEYSPRHTPLSGQWSCLRQGPGEPPVQQVVRFPWAGGSPEVVTTGLSDVGYYTWIDEDELALFVLAGDAHQLVYYPMRTGRQRIAADHIGRCLVTWPDRQVLFVHKVGESVWFLKKYDPATGTLTLVAETPGKTEDFAATPSGSILMGSGGSLFAWKPGTSITWERVADLAPLGIRKITRLAVHPSGTQLILVNERETP